MSNTQNRAKHPAPPTLVPDEITPDPYPERLTGLGGVRQHTAPTTTRTRKSTTRPWQRGRRHPFGASILMTITGQGLLAAAIAAQHLSPIVGAAAAVGLLVCGLGLIVAEMLQVAGR